ncbi:MAG: cytochrome c oxidase subunit II [Thiobacillaceae bacterium]|nr:cytochrome c oxidase subunit II [Thiobacillaceae bacterium]
MSGLPCVRRIGPFAVQVTAAWAATVSTVWAQWAIDLQPPKAEFAQRIYDLHVLILLVCLGIFVVVFGAMFYALWRYRKSLGHTARPFHEHTAVEVAWTLIPFLILVAMAWPATQAVLMQKDTADPELTIKVTGYQWKWEYDYLTLGVKFMSSLATPREQIEGRAPKDAHYLLEVDAPMVVPVGKKVRLLLTANDVIHAWWVPALGVKQDAIPGFVREAWFRATEPGVYRGQCAELCGTGHAFMPIVVEVRTQEGFEAWLRERQLAQARAAAEAQQRFTLKELMARGERVYAAHCSACHQANGRGLPGVFPALAGSKLVLGPAAAHIDIVLNGRPGTAMAAFRNQLSDVELAAVITYERNTWGNAAGVVQPAEVKARR